MRDADLVLTPGVTRTTVGLTFAALGHAILDSDPDRRAALLDGGFASERRGSLWRSRTRSVLVRESPSASVRQSFRHNAIGMRRWWAVLALLGVVGIVTQWSSALGIGIAGALFLCSILVHEAGHVLAFRMLARSATGVLVSRGARCHLVRRALDTGGEWKVIVAGPFAPLAVTALISPFAWIVPVGFWWWAALAVGHAVCLLLPIGDGANLRLSARRG